MKHTFLTSTFVLVTSALSSHAALTISFPGNTSTDGWDQLVGSRLTGYGSYPGTSPWPAPVSPNVAGSTGDATFNKTSGGGYFATNSFYDGGNSGSLVVESSNPVANLATIVFQIDMGASSFASTPQLLVNGTDLYPADLSATYAGDYTYSFGGPATATNNFVFQWDLSGVTDPITSYQVQWETAPHSLIYELQVDSSDNFVAVIPEPSTALLTLFAGSALLRRRRTAR
ncbi:PEP-CTERM sorting domain-containing protein [Roseibacillus persicicus]|uniref:PEP-CTERM protein-sorting domain-containing protein n=1 Tax=Roseibacillus persicicus TaxID=454148 RepID=A0A918TUV2_9BACT|nr:PEP-CTERM sorting domain-containing protein [Roseibacillus persicicus]GHC61060.1 hypothetical protein GCM10007100_30410 [Roseibacillus persicicus]